MRQIQILQNQRAVALIGRAERKFASQVGGKNSEPSPSDLPREGSTQIGGHDRKPVEVKSKPGYVVAGLVLKGGHRVDGFAVIFLRRTARGLDTEDVIVSPWQGGRGGGAERIVGGAYPAVGVHGRVGADVDALGLIQRNHWTW